MKKVLIASALLSVPVFWLLRGTPPEQDSVIVEPVSNQQQMLKLQHELQNDPNQADLWFQLGQGYLTQQEFDSALTCFDYALRLSESPTANQFSAKASALYYQQKQQMTKEVRLLLDRALQLDRDNLTALTLLASDHYISLRYAQAVAIWTQLLESQNPDLDRVAVIYALNQAKQML
ncbi:tetratricopeptide repeat protein [Vibrio ponticus]|uniref:Tetratricopeptide repeat protein n=1 Tax=Vibrio ponticus TaxID=265668 RepID=A0A3N3E4G1_9VIBR|nr:tetratricopeptide repeat protein [Vibrio ponticus]ROV58786.1 tetratricopeptide repeat protein [Vibrio ponticus]ROV61631.1 tetratricopeptide repeat protein [Vibrio ponticus]